MAGLADLLAASDDALYADALSRASQGFGNYQIRPNRNYSTGDVFALEALKGLGSGITGALGNVYGQRAESQMAKQKLSQALAMQEIQARRDMEKMALKAGLENGTVSFANEESLPRGFSLSEAVSPDFSQLPLTEEQKTVIPLLKPKDRPGKIAEFIKANTSEEGKDRRQEEKRGDWWKQVGVDQKNQALEVPKVAREGIALVDKLKNVVPKYNAVEWFASVPINGTEAQRINAELGLWAQKATRLMDKGALTEGDKKKLQEIAAGKGTWFSRPSTLYPLLDRVSKGLITGTTNQLKAAKTAYEKGGDALISELESFTGQDIENRKGESPPIPERYEVMSGKGPNGFPLVKDRKTGQIGEWQ